MKAAGILRVPSMCSRDILLQAKGDHLDQVHSDQMVLEMIRPGRLVRWSHSSAEAKSLKLGLQGSSDYHPNEIAVKAAGRGPMDRIKGLLSWTIYSRRELDNRSKPNWTRAKHSLPENTTIKERATQSFSRWRCRRELLMSVMMMMSENQLSESQVHVMAFRGTEG